ncbi:MAG: orotidine-5-phosphate decarboxylase [Actinomycetota bacterium]|nr:orotidine-5-phosphate decarboxylase [Actinomycetota bacterium]
MTRGPVSLDNPICVALDLKDADAIRDMAMKVEEHVGVYKIGLTAFAGAGPSLVSELGARRPVFVDLKLHDIPAQVSGAVEAIAAGGASYATIHASGGSDMIRAAVDASGSVTILAVTVLTSLDSAVLQRVGFSGNAQSVVLRLAEEALGAGAPGLVCSPLEIDSLREEFGARADGGPLLVVPGIRSHGAARDDQRRTLSAREAMDAGADMIVVGRPITASSDPASAARQLQEELRESI